MIGAMRHESFMQRAHRLAKVSLGTGDRPFGAVVVVEGKVIGEGRSMSDSTDDFTAHAEITALRNVLSAGTSLEGASIYTTAEPCPMCAWAILQVDFSEVIIGVTRDDLPDYFRPRKTRFRTMIEDSRYDPKVVEGVMREDILKLFQGQPGQAERKR